MEDNKTKKKKLTLTVSTKKSQHVPQYTLGKQKTSVVIEKKISRKRKYRKKIKRFRC